MKYAVHLLTQVRVKVVGVEAESMAQAMEKAGNAVDFHALLDNGQPRCAVSDGMSVEYVEWNEAPTECACVDQLTDTGEIDDENTAWLEHGGEPLVDGLTAHERKTRGYDSAELFMQELLDSVETLAGIAEQHGARTLADLMYLHSAILSNGFVDHYPDESKALDIARNLPSGEQWVKFIKVEYMASAEVLEIDVAEAATSMI